jgi:hypothetical protein
MRNKILSFLLFLAMLVLIVARDTVSQARETAGLELTNYFQQVQTFNQGIALLDTNSNSSTILTAPPVVSNYNLVLPGSGGVAGFYVCIGSTAGTWTYCGPSGSTAPVVTTTPSRSIRNPLNFGSVQTTTSGNLAIVVANSGNAQLTFSSITLTGSATFAKSSTCGSTLDAGATCNITITFTPVAVTSYSGTLSIADNASGSPQLVSLVGTGTTAPVVHSVVLTWVASSSTGVLGYNVYRGTQSGGPYTLLNTPIIAGLAYTDNAVSNGQTYCYVVTSVSSASEGGYSTEACAVIP